MKIDELYRRMFEEVKGERTMKMGFSMLRFVKILVASGKKRHLSRKKRAEQILRRFYGDLGEKKIEKILGVLESR